MDAVIFIISLAAAVIIYWFLVPGRWRGPFLLLLSVGFIAALNVIYAAYYISLAALVYITASLMAQRPKRKKHILLTALLILIGNLCLYKCFQAGPHAIIFPLGLSYMTFRLVHYLIEAYREKIPKASLADFSLYALFFPTFLAGPVERFPDFHRQTGAARHPALSEVNYGLFRILLGILKKFVIADHLYGIVAPAMVSPQDLSRGAFISCVYLSAIWLYMELGGYTDMAIGISRLFGYKIIENFNRPYLKKNIALFWRNWHISVYSWIRDYFYLPVFVYRGSRFKLYAGIFCTMMVFMLWHKVSWGFLFAGLYHSFGLIVWNLFQEAKKRSEFLRRMTAHKFLDPVSVFFTFSYVAFGIGIPFFGGDLVGIKAILEKMIS